MSCNMINCFNRTSLSFLLKVLLSQYYVGTAVQQIVGVTISRYL